MAVTPLFCACTPAGTSPRALRCFDAVTVLALSRFACLTGNDTDMYWVTLHGVFNRRILAENLAVQGMI